MSALEFAWFRYETLRNSLHPLDAGKYLGTPKDRIVQKTMPGGHIGLFMGARTLKEHWPQIARWIAAQ